MKWLTPEQVAADPRLPRGNADWVRKQLRSGRLRGSLIDGRWYVPEDSIEEMLQSGTNDTRRRRRRSA
jgi:hypothetical protein